MLNKANTAQVSQDDLKKLAQPKKKIKVEGGTNPNGNQQLSQPINFLQNQRSNVLDDYHQEKNIKQISQESEDIFAILEKKSISELRPGLWDDEDFDQFQQKPRYDTSPQIDSLNGFLFKMIKALSKKQRKKRRYIYATDTLAIEPPSEFEDNSSEFEYSQLGQRRFEYSQPGQ